MSASLDVLARTLNCGIQFHGPHPIWKVPFEFDEGITHRGYTESGYMYIQ